MTIQEKQQALIDDFDFLEDWEQKYEYLIDLGKNLKGYPEEKRNDDYLIRGCQSKVWIFAEIKGDKIYFKADSNGILPKGLVSMLSDIYSGQTAEAIMESNFDFIKKIGLQEFLSPTRANGLAAMVKQIRFYAAAYQVKS